MESLTLLSTVVAPEFGAGRLELEPVAPRALPELLARVTRNLCGHPSTVAALQALCPTLPAAERAFWSGEGEAIAVRPRGGVRAVAAEGETVVSLPELEAVVVRWVPNGTAAAVYTALGEAVAVTETLYPGTLLAERVAAAYATLAPAAGVGRIREGE